MSLRSIARALCPARLVEIVDARRVLAPVSRQPWRDAFSSKKRDAIRVSRFTILPPALRKSPLFVIDVGANEGQWIGALTEILAIPEVWIFEPNPEALKNCRERMGSGPGVRYFNMALGETAGHITLHLTEASVFASVLQPREEFLDTQYGKNVARVTGDKQVEVCTLDSLVPPSKSVDLLKIDVQGFERAVLSGGRRVLANTRVVLI